MVIPNVTCCLLPQDCWHVLLIFQSLYFWQCAIRFVSSRTLERMVEGKTKCKDINRRTSERRIFGSNAAVASSIFFLCHPESNTRQKYLGYFLSNKLNHETSVDLFIHCKESSLLVIVIILGKGRRKKRENASFFFFTAVITHPNEDKKGYLYQEHDAFMYSETHLLTS